MAALAIGFQFFLRSFGITKISPGNLGIFHIVLRGKVYERVNGVGGRRLSFVANGNEVRAPRGAWLMRAAGKRSDERGGRPHAENRATVARAIVAPGRNEVKKYIPSGIMRLYYIYLIAIVVGFSPGKSR